MNSSLPPDGFMDESGPPDGFEDHSVENPGIIDKGMGLLKKAVPVANKLFEMTPPGLMLKQSQLMQQGFDLAGEKVAEGLGGAGVNPNVSAGVGTAIQMAPDIAMAASTLKAPAASLGKSVQKRVGKFGRLFAGGVEKLTGIPEANTAAAFTKPSALFTAPTQSAVSEAYAKSEFPEIVQNIDEIIQKGTSSSASVIKRGAQAIRGFVEEGVENPKAIVEGRQALDKQIALLKNQIQMSKGPGKAALQNALEGKLNLRATFNRALDRMAPAYRQADALAAERFEVAPFRQVTLPGKVNLFSPEGLLRSIPGLPPAIGTAVSGLGAVGKGVSELASKTPRMAGVGYSQILRSRKKEAEIGAGASRLFQKRDERR